MKLCETGEYASHILKDWRVQLESIISRPIALCYLPSRLNRQRAKPYFWSLTGFQGLRGPLGWEPVQATAGAAAAAEVTVTGVASSCLPRDGADVGAAANTIAGASGGSRIFERGRGQVPKARGSRRCRRWVGMGRERGCENQRLITSV